LLVLRVVLLCGAYVQLGRRVAVAHLFHFSLGRNVWVGVWVSWAVCAVLPGLCARGVLRGSMAPDGLVRRGWVRCYGLCGAYVQLGRRAAVTVTLSLCHLGECLGGCVGQYVLSCRVCVRGEC
jgi:branched-subunit amino acid transport protein